MELIEAIRKESKMATSHKFQIGDLVKEKITTNEEIFEIQARYVNVDTERLVYAVVEWEGYDEYTLNEEDLELWDGKAEDED